MTNETANQPDEPSKCEEVSTSGSSDCYQAFPSPVKLGFDPMTEDEDHAKVFKDDVARTLYLLWRPGHIVDQYFSKHVLLVATAIRRNRPSNVDALVACFRYRAGHPYWTERDVRTFCAKALPYFLGEATVEYELCLT